MKVLLIGEIHPAAEELLQNRTDKIELKKIKEKEFLEKESFPEIKAVVLRTFTKLGKKELDRFPQLKFIISCSVGTDNLDLTELEKRKIELIYCPGSNANSVAEHTIYLMLSLLRKEKPFEELKGKTIGIIGLGAIGKKVAEKLKGFEVKVKGFDVIKQEPKILDELKVEMKDFDSIIREVDILTIHIPLNKQTNNLFNKNVFEKMKKGVFLINTSRAEVIDEKALLEHFDKLGGLGVDVYSEWLKEKLKEKADKKMVLTNHVGAQGKDSFREMCLKPIEMFLEIKN